MPIIKSTISEYFESYYQEFLLIIMEKLLKHKPTATDYDSFSVQRDNRGCDYEFLLYKGRAVGKITVSYTAEHNILFTFKPQV